ncbi:MAG: gliding motility lipoprotein GldK, partial [Cyclobacteriaceae bacterium]|nr:gliding motility lipoprotein GldK [Cyclobacteriaceae bacterium]
MSKLFVIGKPAFLILIVAVLNQSCGLFGGRGGDNGELVGTPGREWTGMVIPYGMVPIPAGTFHMGQADEDIAATQINFNKQVTIGAF